MFNGKAIYDNKKVLFYDIIYSLANQFYKYHVKGFTRKTIRTEKNYLLYGMLDRFFSLSMRKQLQSIAADEKENEIV